MSNLLYLGIAIVVTFIGWLILWYRQRRPRSLESGIDDFRRGLSAIAPERERDRQ